MKVYLYGAKLPQGTSYLHGNREGVAISGNWLWVMGEREKAESNDMLSADKVSGEEMLSGSQEVTQQFVPITSN